MTSLARLLPLVLCVAPVFAKDYKVFPSGADYSKYKTYSWVSVRLLTPDGISENDDRIAPLVRAAIDKMLQSKGLKQVPSNGDLVVQTMVMYTPRIQLNGYLVMYGFDAFNGWSPVGGEAIGGVVKAGTLAAALVDPIQKKGIWSGLAFEGVGALGRIGGSVDKAVSEIFKKYPSLN